MTGRELRFRREQGQKYYRGHAKIPARENFHIMVTMRRGTVAETSETVKEAVTSGERRTEALPRASANSRKGKIRIMESSKLHPGG